MEEKQVSLTELVDETHKSLTRLEQEELAKQIYEMFPSQKISECQVSTTFFDDLEFFAGNKIDPDNFVFQELNQTHTLLGKLTLENCLKHPITDKDKLKCRQINIKKIQDATSDIDLDVIFQEMAELEKEIIWFWKPKTPELTQVYDMVYFSGFPFVYLNDVHLVLKWYNYLKIIIYPIYGLVSPIIWFLIPYLVTRYWFKLPLTLRGYYNATINGFFNNKLLSLILRGVSPTIIMILQYGYVAMILFFYVYGIYISFEIAINLNRIINMMHSKLNKVSQYLRHCQTIMNHISLLVDISDGDSGINYNICNMEMSTDLLTNSLFESEPSLFSNKGDILTTFRQFNKEEILSYIHYVSQVEMYYSISKLLENKYSLVSYLDLEKPTIKINQLVHPSILNCVSNQLDVAGNNLIITGGNASGKSTFIKSLVISLLLGQTIGVAPCQNLELTLFTYLGTYLNIPDTKGKKSLFQAEMEQIFQNIDLIKTLPDKSFSLLIMDELLNSTNYYEGVSGAYSVARKLGEFSDNITILTTHYPYLTKLEIDTNNYLNYYFNVVMTDGQVNCDYKLVPGVSEQGCALELLKLKGFDEEMMRVAQEAYQELKKNNIKVDIKEDIKEDINISEKEASEDSQLVDVDDSVV